MKKAILWILSVLTLCSVAVGAFILFRNWNSKAQLKDLIFPVIDLKTGKQGYMDVNGNIVIQPVYNYANEFQSRWEGLSFVWDEAGYKLIDKLGNIRSQSNYPRVQYYPADDAVLAGYKLKGSDEMRFGYFKLDGSVILQPEYIQLSPLINGRAFAQMQDKHWYIIDQSGGIFKKLDENIQYIQVMMIPSGYVAFTREGNGMDPFMSYSEWMLSKWGYMDIDGNVIFEMNDADSHVTAFENGRALISKAYQNYMKMYIIDLMGNVVVDLGRSNLSQYQHQGVGYFSDGVACIVDRNSVGFGAIDSNGEWIVDPKYNGIRYSGGVLTAKIDDDHYIFFNKQGAKLFECNYPCTQYMDGYFFQLKDDCFYMMDRNGNAIMQIPEGYMPARSDFYNNAWKEWKQKHINQAQ